jgi:hypothetical protein
MPSAPENVVLTCVNQYAELAYSGQYINLGGESLLPVEVVLVHIREEAPESHEYGHGLDAGHPVPE